MYIYLYRWWMRGWMGVFLTPVLSSRQWSAWFRRCTAELWSFRLQSGALGSCGLSAFLHILATRVSTISQNTYNHCVYKRDIMWHRGWNIRWCRVSQYRTFNCSRWLWHKHSGIQSLFCRGSWANALKFWIGAQRVDGEWIYTSDNEKILFPAWVNHLSHSISPTAKTGGILHLSKFSW